MTFPFMPPFNMQTLMSWCNLHKPTSIDMTDKQYSWLTDLMHTNVLSVNAIPITFIDAPKT